MTDSNNEDKRGGPRGRSDKGRSSGDRPFRSRTEAGDRPRREGGDKPFRARSDDSRPRKPREAGDKPFRARREDGDRPFRSRPEGGDRFARPRRSEGAGEGGFRPKREGGERPFRGRQDERPRRFSRDGEDRPRAPRREEPVQVEATEPTEERIAKVIARAGVASRRDVEAMIAEGRVSLNGKVLESPAINVGPDDKITVDGEPLPAKERTRLFLYHKPRGLVTTARDPEGRPTVFDNLPEDLPRVVAVGRLDINTEGLLLLTNDGGLARVIAHPDTGWLRRYKVRAFGELTQADLDQIRDGVVVDGMEYGPVEARLDRVQGHNLWISLGLREGKNREVKRILEHLGVQVNRLIRLSFGPFQLGEIEEGGVEEIRTRFLKDQLGEALAAEAGVDFESPVREPIAPFGSSKKERPARPERQERSERGGRFSRDRDEDRPRRGRDGDKPMRGRGKDHEEEPESKRPSRLDPKRSIWRAGEDPDAPTKKIPRRGADPKEARAVSGERKRERVGAIKTEGRKVLVERLVAAPKDESPARKPRRAGPGAEDRPRRRPERDEAYSRADRSDESPWQSSGKRPARPRSDDAERPRRPQGERSFRARSDDAERPRRPRPEGDRPFRSRGEGGDRPQRSERPFQSRGSDERPRSSSPRGDKPFRPRGEGGDRPQRSERPFRARGEAESPRRGPPRGDKPFRGGPSKGGPRGGAGGGFKGGSKGGPRGRRP